MAICQWHKCGREFTPTIKGQKFCPGGKCQVAHNNWLKMTGIHFIPQVYYYIKGIADSCHVSVDEKANEIMLTLVPLLAEQLKSHEKPGEYLKTLEGLNK